MNRTTFRVAAVLIILIVAICIAIFEVLAQMDEVSARTPVPTWMMKAAKSGPQGIGIQGWGPGASGISIRYLYDPYARTLSTQLLRGLEQGIVISTRGYFPSGEMSQGGAAYVVMTFVDGTSITIDRAIHSPAKKFSLYRPSTSGVYYVQVTSITPSGNQKSSTSRSFCLVDTAGTIGSVRKEVFSAMLSMDPESVLPPPQPTTAWLRQLNAQDVASYAVIGNNGTHLFQHPLGGALENVPGNGLGSTLGNALGNTLGTALGNSLGNRAWATLQLADVLAALRRGVVIPPAKVESTLYGTRSWSRTHARSLCVTFQNGDTVQFNAGYGLVKKGQGVRTNANLFRVSWTTQRGTTSVFVKDNSGVLRYAWSVVDQVSLAPRKAR